MKAAAGRLIAQQGHHTDIIAQSILPMAQRRLEAARHRVELMEERAKALDPTLLLRRGYSITLRQGRAVRDAASLRSGDEIETRLENGTIKSIVK